MNSILSNNCLEIKVVKFLNIPDARKPNIKLPKRVTKKAVKRNKIKRRLKSILRNIKDPEIKILIKIKKNLIRTKFKKLTSIVHENLERIKSE